MILALVSSLLLGYVAFAEKALVIPLRYDKNLKAVVVDCAFDSHPSRNGCVLDLGNSSWQPFVPGDLVPDMKRLANFSPQPKTMITGCFAKQNASVQMGGLFVPARWVYPCAPAAGLGNIGLTALEGGIWKFDFKRNELTKLGRLPSNLNLNKLHRRENAFDLGIETLIGGSHFVASLDTGAGWSYFDRSFILKNKNSFRPQSPDDDSENTIFDRIEEFESAGVRFGGEGIALVTDFAKSKQYGNLTKSGWPAVFGMDLLRGHVWYFDLKNNLWAIEKI